MRHQTYEEAARDYLAKFRDLMQQPLDVNAVTGQGEMPVEFLVKRAEEIGGISTKMIALARAYFDSADPAVREGISGHFVDQASVELLLGTELMQRTEARENGPAPLAAQRATQNAALREAISAAEKSTSIPVTRGLPASISYRTTESANPDEAAIELISAVISTSTGISRRVQELGAEIAFDLVQRTEWDEITRGTGLSDGEIVEFWADAPNPAGKLVVNVYQKIAALLDRGMETEVREKTGKWLYQIKQGHDIRCFDLLLPKPDAQGAIQNSIQRSGAAREIINQTSDLIKTVSDRFITLIARMRKLEDAIRLSKSVRLPQWSLTVVALQTTLLSALVFTGRQYVDGRVLGILRDRGFGS
jgi:hypothetical protein